MPDQGPSGSVNHVDHAAMDALAGRLDELGHQASNVMTRYEEAFNHALASQTFAGGAGAASVVTGGEIVQAQSKINHKFQMVNDHLRSGGAKYAASDADNKAAMQGVMGQIKFH
jgi:uncharacterized protein YukE